MEECGTIPGRTTPSTAGIGLFAFINCCYRCNPYQSIRNDRAFPEAHLNGAVRDCALKVGNYASMPPRSARVDQGGVEAANFFLTAAKAPRSAAVARRASSGGIHDKNEHGYCSSSARIAGRKRVSPIIGTLKLL